MCFTKGCFTTRNSRRSIKLDRKEEEKSTKKSKASSLKYTAAKLHEKGVILEIEGLQTNQYVLPLPISLHSDTNN